MGSLRTSSVSVLAGAVLGCIGFSPTLLMAQGAEQAVAPSSPAPAIRIVERIDDARLVTLRGNTHPMARAALDAGRLSADTRMGDLVLVLRRSPEQQAAFSTEMPEVFAPVPGGWGRGGSTMVRLVAGADIVRGALTTAHGNAERKL